MKIDCVYVNPGGNPTVLVLTRIQREEQVIVARKIMKKIPECEQVGFIERAKNPKALCRLQMAGGEFCGNALRSLAVWLASKSVKNDFIVETSGANTLIPISADLKQMSAETTIPILKKYKAVNKVISINKKLVPVKLINFPGISFLLAAWDYNKNRIKFRPLFTNLLKEKNFKSDACGIVFYKTETYTNFTIMPIIYVKKTNTVIEETSCASGSMALAVCLGLRKITVLQPSGYILHIRRSKKGITVSGQIKSYKSFKLVL